MTDRELLECAAKAARIESFWGTGWEAGHMYRSTPRPNSPLLTNTRWNPLDDDGDALRLAVKLGIEIFPDLQVNEVHTAYAINGHGYNTFEEIGDDALAATRRAIVRAAAEIGRSKS